jgi:hypothetical protein
MRLERGTLEFKLNPKPFPAFPSKPPNHAVREAWLDLLHVHMKVIEDFSKQEDDAILIQWGIDQTTKVNQIADH